MLVTELRFDPLSGRWVAISPARADRPDAFLVRTPWVDSEPRACPFCPGATGEGPPLAQLEGPDGAWTSRILSNRYPAFDGDDPFVMVNRGPVFTEATAGGTHEVLVFSPDHAASFADLDDRQVRDIMQLLRRRLTEHATMHNLRYTQVIINFGREAGASIEHPHGQLLGISFVPRDLAYDCFGCTPRFR